jgi:hypothetical protein
MASQAGGAGEARVLCKRHPQLKSIILAASKNGFFWCFFVCLFFSEIFNPHNSPEIL